MEGSAPPKRVAFQGPCYLKLLVSNIVAGAVIGKSGSVIAQIEQQTGCALKLSPANMYYPGTEERILIMSGEQEALNDAVIVVMLRIVAPNSAVAAIIGKGGQQIKELQEATNARVQVSNREEGLVERLITVSGHLEEAKAAALAIAACLQNDPNLKSHMYVVYKAAGASFGAPLSLPYGGPSAGYGGPYGTYTAGTPGPDILSQQCEIYLHVPEAVIGAVIGKSGRCVSEIMKQTGARVQISHKGDFVPGTTDRKIVVSGSVAAVHNAHVLLLQRVHTSQEAASQANGLNSSSNSGVDVHSGQQPHAVLQGNMQYLHPTNFGY
ncbi:RNA-binding protein nova-1 [Cyclospora cayetanensis]|uniref:RNA-binding protein nova-1 n=1 Tax=Cyclospora cayetanensis TaxID=88456 RepID=A0A1D3D0Y3_9EIME|nr:RNA-binding protein nova-1 [Cyclospora cayetanensis]